MVSHNRRRSGSKSVGGGPTLCRWRSTRRSRSANSASSEPCRWVLKMASAATVVAKPGKLVAASGAGARRPRPPPPRARIGQRGVENGRRVLAFSCRARYSISSTGMTAVLYTGRCVVGDMKNNSPQIVALPSLVSLQTTHDLPSEPHVFWCFSKACLVRHAYLFCFGTHATQRRRLRRRESGRALRPSR